MLRNDVVESDLTQYFPKLANYLWKDVTTFLNQRTAAFEMILADLRSRKIDVRKLQIPLDLNRAADSTSDQNTTTSLTKTITYTSTHINSLQGFRRFIFDVSAIVATACTYTVKLQGSNDIDVDSTTEPVYWTDIGTNTITAVGVTSVLYQVEYKYYRYVLTITGATASITYKTFLVETYPEQLIIWKTFEIVFRDFSRERDDVWTERMASARENYNTAIESLVYINDSNDDNIPDADEEETTTLTLIQ